VFEAWKAIPGIEKVLGGETGQFSLAEWMTALREGYPILDAPLKELETHVDGIKLNIVTPNHIHELAKGNLEEYIDLSSAERAMNLVVLGRGRFGPFFTLRAGRGAHLRNATQTPPMYSAQADAAAIRSSWTRRRML
jgi:hypothetical protein